MPDCCIIGGGIIGLSVARELAGRGHGVRVLSRDPRRDTASWAAAGIFPPAPWRNGLSPGDALTAWSDRLHREWARDLRAQTGIDTGLEACGGLHLTGDESGWPRLDAEMREWLARGAACERLDGRGAAECEPTLAWAVDRGTVIGGYVLPEEMQMRPPRHLEALERSCLGRGVTLLRDAEVEDVIFDLRRGVSEKAKVPFKRVSLVLFDRPFTMAVDIAGGEEMTAVKAAEWAQEGSLTATIAPENAAQEPSAAPPLPTTQARG